MSVPFLYMEAVMPGFFVAGPNSDQDSCGNLNDAKIISAGLDKRQRPYNDIEVNRKYRYKVVIYGRTDWTTYIESCTRPKLEFDKITIHNGQDEIYRPGKSRWSPVTMSFYEAVFYQPSNGRYIFTNQVAQYIYDWALSGTKFVNGQSSIAKVDSLYKNVEIDMENGGGFVVRKYKLFGCWPISVSPGDLSYSSNEIAKIDIEMSYNRAMEELKAGTDI